MNNLSNTVENIDNPFWIITIISGAITIAVTIAMIYFVIRYHKSRNPKASQIHGHLPLEVIWTVVPTLIAIYMFYIGYEGFILFREKPRNAFQVEVIGRQWDWDFVYPNGRKDTKTLRLPKGQPVMLMLKSNDVNHSLFIPKYRVKEDVIAGQTTYLTFTPLEAGTFDIFCAEYCGLQHSSMLAKLIVMPEKDFYNEFYYKPQKQDPIPIETAMNPDSWLERGENVFLQQCASCHGKEGQGLLETARNFANLDGWTRGSKVPQIFTTLQEGIEGTQMASFAHLPNEDLFAAAHYVRTFAEGSPTAGREEFEQLDEQYGFTKGSGAKQELPVRKAMELIAEEYRTQNGESESSDSETTGDESGAS